jgi:hypothetical protein
MSDAEFRKKRKVKWTAPPKEPFPPEAENPDGSPNFEHPWWDFLIGLDDVP